MLFLEMHAAKVNGFHLGLFGGWNRYSQQNYLVVGLEQGIRVNVGSGFFLDPTLNGCYMQKTNGSSTTRTLPISFFTKIGYTVSGFSVYGLLGGGLSFLIDNKTKTVGHFTTGGGMYFKVFKVASIFTQYTYDRLSNTNQNRVVGGVQFHF